MYNKKIAKINYIDIIIVDPEKDSESPDNPERKSILKKISSLLPFGRPETKEDLEQEIQELLEEGEEHGLITSLEEKMITSILDFRETEVAEIMTPVSEVISFDAADDVTDLVGLVFEHGFTRVPVYRDNPDNILGFIHAKDLLKLVLAPKEEQILDHYLHPVIFVSEVKPIVDLLRDFQKGKGHLAMVTDEFGAIRGLISMEDILEEIVGEIDDEYDEDEDELEILEGGVVRAHARIDVEKIEEYFGVEFPEGGYESIGGMIILALGRLGQEGDSVEISGLQFLVKSATARHIGTVEITDLRPSQGKPLLLEAK